MRSSFCLHSVFSADSLFLGKRMQRLVAAQLLNYSIFGLVTHFRLVAGGPVCAVCCLPQFTFQCLVVESCRSELICQGRQCARRRHLGQKKLSCTVRLSTCLIIGSGYENQFPQASLVGIPANLKPSANRNLSASCL